MATSEGEKQTCWYVMRDLKRANAKLPAYKQLLNEHFEVFTPMKEQLSVHGGKRTREEVPFIQDLLFVHDTQEAIEKVSHDTVSFPEGRWLQKSDDCR